MIGRGTLKRIGILGGSFDPPHLGHIICSRVVAEVLNLDQIILMPVSTQPHRLGGAVANEESRYRMVEAICRIDPIYSPSRLEIDRSGISYTVNTVEQLIKMYPLEKHQLFWIIGMDTAMLLDSWRKPEKIAELAHFAVMQRPGYSDNFIPTKWAKVVTTVETPYIDISSTIIRQRIKENLPIRPWVSIDVEKVIISERLYK